MLTGFPYSEEWQSPSRVKTLFGATRWNQYVLNWPVLLAALQRLWEMEKVSEFKTPFYEPVKNDLPVKNGRP
jgi:hypothetical protein